MTPGTGESGRWVRVPMARRKKSVSGLEHLVGAADQEWAGGSPQPDTAQEHDEDNRPMDPATLPEFEPELEIESLIIPAVEELHTAHVKSCQG